MLSSGIGVHKIQHLRVGFKCDNHRVVVFLSKVSILDPFLQGMITKWRVESQSIKIGLIIGEELYRMAMREKHHLPSIPFHV